MTASSKGEGDKRRYATAVHSGHRWPDQLPPMASPMGSLPRYSTLWGQPDPADRHEAPVARAGHGALGADPATFAERLPSNALHGVHLSAAGINDPQEW